MFSIFKKEIHSSAKTFGCFMRCKRCPNKKMDAENKYCIHLEACEWSYAEGVRKSSSHVGIGPVPPGDMPLPEDWVR